MVLRKVLGGIEGTYWNPVGLSGRKPALQKRKETRSIEEESSTLSGQHAMVASLIWETNAVCKSLLDLPSGQR